MDEHRIKPAVALKARTDSLLMRLPLPKINPNFVSGLSVISSVFFILALGYSQVLAFAIAVAVLVFDALDGIIARKYRLETDEGYMIDVTSDRLSEGIMFVPFFMPWFFLFAANCFLTLIGFRMKRHIILPLRHIFVIYLAIVLLL